MALKQLLSCPVTSLRAQRTRFSALLNRYRRQVSLLPPGSPTVKVESSSVSLWRPRRRPSWRQSAARTVRTGQRRRCMSTTAHMGCPTWPWRLPCPMLRTVTCHHSISTRRWRTVMLTQWPATQPRSSRLGRRSSTGQPRDHRHPAATPSRRWAPQCRRRSCRRRRSLRR